MLVKKTLSFFLTTPSLCHAAIYAYSHPHKVVLTQEEEIGVWWV